MAETPLSSLWDGLSPHLLATFYVVEPSQDDMTVWHRSETDASEVVAPFTEANFEVDLTWQNSFENAGAESKAPALMAMLQSGSFQPVIDAVFGEKGQPTAAKLSEYVSQAFGRTGITKLNSTQIFLGMPCYKITGTLLFRAWRDAVSEVEKPIDKLMSWALPQKLSPDGSIFSRAVQTTRGEMGYLDALMPSVAPLRIGMRYKNRNFYPLVIENISMPLTSPINSEGHFVNIELQITLSSLAAIDRDDWANTKTQTIAI